MELLPDKPEDIQDEREGFLDFLNSDDFTAWLADYLKGRPRYIREIVKKLIDDSFLYVPDGEEKTLPTELYHHFTQRIKALRYQKFLFRTEKGQLGLKSQSRRTPTQANSPARQQRPGNPSDKPEAPTSPEYGLERRIRRAKLGTAGFKGTQDLDRLFGSLHQPDK